MLSLRFIRQLTDSALLDRPLISQCCRHTARQWTPRPPPARRPIIAAPHSSLPPPHHQSLRHSSSSTRWKSRQGRDHFAKEARVRGLKSRAAFKLLEMHAKYRLFRAGDTVVDLGYAPGSWAQVAINRTAPGGRVVGIDVIPAQPPRGVSTIQGNFLSPEVQAEVRAYVQDPERGRPIQRPSLASVAEAEEEEEEEEEEGGEGEESDESDEGQGESADGGIAGPPRGLTAEELEEQQRGYIDMERRASLIAQPDEDTADADAEALLANERQRKLSKRERDRRLGRVVDVVLSDMSAPWDQTSGFHKRSVSDPYHRMMNTSGIAFRDHAGSMDLCNAALTFAFDTLRTGGHFVCKFYQGGEDKALEKRLRRMFDKVFREKPESSRSESKEAYFVALRRKADPLKDDVFRE